MVRDGYFYGASLLLVAVLVLALTAGTVLGWCMASIPVILAAFFLWFFRDPKRAIPQGSGLVVSPADGKVTEITHIHTPDGERIRLSIFLSVFNVHVNRAPVTGIVREVKYKKGQFLNALNPESAERNEQSIVTMEGEGCFITMKLIAGLLARRIVFHPKEGDLLERGQRVGLIKFGSRCDVVLPADAQLRITKGQSVQGGATILANVEVPSYEPMLLKDIMECRT